MSIQYDVIKSIIKRKGPLSISLYKYYDDYNNFLEGKIKDKPIYADYEPVITHPEKEIKKAYNVFCDNVYNLMERGVSGIDNYLKIMTFNSEQTKHMMFRFDDEFIIFTAKNDEIIDIRKFHFIC